MSRANVYIIGGKEGPKKIGISDDPVQRIITLQRRVPLSVVATYPRDAGDAGVVERVAHRLLREKRVVGEWFDVTNDEAIAAVREAISLVDSGNLEPSTRKSMTLPDTIWSAIDCIRRSWSGAVPSEVDVVRTLLREAIDARAAKKAPPGAARARK